MFFSDLRRHAADPGPDGFLGNLYSYGAMLSFTTAHAAVVALRVKEPDRERPYRIPFTSRSAARAIPVSAVLGGIGTFAAWVSVMALHVDARYVGTGWMLVGHGGYVVFRRRAGSISTRHHKIYHRERPAFFVELEYRSALVPIFGTDVDASALRAAAKLVGEGALVEAIYVLRVPNQLSLDAGLERGGAARPERARGRQGHRPQGWAEGPDAADPHPQSWRSDRRGGAALGAEIIYLGTAHAPPSERALGPTASYLLAHRPCRVVIETRPPMATGAGGGRRCRRGGSAPPAAGIY